MKNKIFILICIFLSQYVFSENDIPIALNSSDMLLVRNIAYSDNINFTPSFSEIFNRLDVEVIILYSTKILSKAVNSNFAKEEKSDPEDYKKITSIILSIFYKQFNAIRINSNSSSNTQKVLYIYEVLNLKNKRRLEGNKIYSILDYFVATTYLSLPDNYKLEFLKNEEILESVSIYQSILFDVKTDKNLFPNEILQNESSQILTLLRSGNQSMFLDDTSYIIQDLKIGPIIFSPKDDINEQAFKKIIEEQIMDENLEDHQILDKFNIYADIR